MISNLHTHTIYCDGKNTPEELVLKAITLGMTEIGFSGHAYTFFDESYCMSKENTKKYVADIVALKEKYKGQISIKLGIEQDYCSAEPTDGYDYVIGSVHYIKKGDIYLDIDDSEETQRKLVAEHYGGDFYAFCEDYYKQVGDVYNKTKCDIVGHFDLVTKFNEGGKLFDENNPRYIKAYQDALAKLLKTNVTFEINYGAVAQGYKKQPYPAKEIIDIIKANGKNMIKSSDCHDKNKLLFGFID